MSVHGDPDNPGVDLIVCDGTNCTQTTSFDPARSGLSHHDFAQPDEERCVT